MPIVPDQHTVYTVYICLYFCEFVRKIRKYFRVGKNTKSGNSGAIRELIQLELLKGILYNSYAVIFSKIAKFFFLWSMNFRNTYVANFVFHEISTTVLIFLYISYRTNVNNNSSFIYLFTSEKTFKYVFGSVKFVDFFFVDSFG
jgi:hypothetical protein